MGEGRTTPCPRVIDRPGARPPRVRGPLQFCLKLQGLGVEEPDPTPASHRDPTEITCITVSGRSFRAAVPTLPHPKCLYSAIKSLYLQSETKAVSCAQQSV